MAENPAIESTASADDSSELVIPGGESWVFFMDTALADEEFVEFYLSKGGVKSTEKLSDSEAKDSPIVMSPKRPMVRLPGPLHVFASKSATAVSKALKYYS